MTLPLRFVRPTPPLRRLLPGRAAIILVLLLLLPVLEGRLHGQGIPVGHWRHHLPGNQVIAVAETPEQIIGATPYGLFLFHKADNSLEPFNKVHGLNDFRISSMAWSEDRDLIIVGYENGNIDVLTAGRQVLNVPDIRVASVMGSKRINRILALGSTAYLACDFGIVELDLTTLLVRDTYYIGPQGSLVQVNDLAWDGTHLWAATGAGLLRADRQAPNLADFQNWHRVHVTGLPDETFTLVAWFDGKVLANLSNAQGDFIYVGDGQGWALFDPFTEVTYFERKNALRSSRGLLLVASEDYLDVWAPGLERIRHYRFYADRQARPLDALIDGQQKIWAGDRHMGLVREHAPDRFESIVPEGPPTPGSFALDAAGGRLWVAPGDISRAGSNSWNQDGIISFGQEKWSHYDRWSVPGLEFVWDIVHITADPSRPGRAFASSWSSGLLEVSLTGVEARYDHTNSTLQQRFEIEDFTRTGGSALDRQGNLWVTNSQVQRPLSVMKPDGSWMAFGSNGLVPTGMVVGGLAIDQSGQKWVILHQGGGIFLFREDDLNSSTSFQARRLTTQNGLPSNEIYSIAVDHSGYVWVGTDAGVAVFYAPQRAFSGEAFVAQLIVVEEQDGFAGYLLEDETVNAITVDGANKKWFGTSRSGAFLLSADARETLFHFTAENSPLPSNNVLDIQIMGETGEVFFATDRGLASFRGLATAGGFEHGEVVAFPNPVRPHHSGYIAIRGLVGNARVKVTDISGNLVHETIAEGGQAVWNGQDLFGRRPATGVYLVFSTNEDGSETMVTKILFIN
jgi:hypothetical protein